MWCALLVGLWLVNWPVFGGLAVAVDDVERLLRPVGSLWDGLNQAWHETLFRPPIVLSTWLVDPATRSAEGLAIVQGLALVVAALPAWRISSSVGLAPGFVLLLWLLHPSVAVSVWQTDTLSQTLSAAAGLWLLALAIGAWRPKARSAWWLALVFLGLMTKETFLGWVPAALAWEFYHRKRLGWVHVVVAAMVLVYVGLRLPIALPHRGALGIHKSLLANVFTLCAGLLTFGPIHLVRVAAQFSPAWLCSLAAPALHLVLLLAGARASKNAFQRAACLWATALLILVPVLIMDHVSELYLMGPNFLTTLALADCTRALSTKVRSAAQFSALGLLLLALWGLASRSYHFGLTWEYSRALAAQLPRLEVRAHQSSDASCSIPVQGHSVYFVSPLIALCPGCTEAVAARRGQSIPDGWATALDCSKLPKRAAW